jgi:hypothetical protein
VLVTASFLMRPHKQSPGPPPPVVVYLAQSNTPLFILPGQETTIILPDGSLWHWGNEEQSPGGGGVPQQVGHGYAWTQVQGFYFGGVGLQRDGSLWAWGNTATQRRSDWLTDGAGPVQIDPGHDWLTANASVVELLAIKKDGSLWSMDRNSTNQFAQVGADHDWKAVQALGNVKLAIRTDGTLWIWGDFYRTSRGAVTSRNEITMPARLCRETNWAGFPRAMGYSAWTDSGELWQFSPQLSSNGPDAQASIASFGSITMTNYRPDHFALALGLVGSMRQRVLYQVRDDGTLWQGSGAFALQLHGTWRRVGLRSDWLEIWGSAGTGFGLTADGTIWTWGTDWSRYAEIPFSARLAFLRDQIARMFNSSATVTGIGPTPVVQDQPRPLMRLVMGGSNKSAALVNAVDPPPERH